MKRFFVLVAAFVGVLPMLAGVAVSHASAQSNASIKIAKPGDRRNVQLSEIPVMVEITGATLSDGYRWQILIDGVPQGMVTDGLTTEITIPKPSGPHRLKAELYDASGATVSAHEILVMAAPVENHDPIFNREWFVPFMAVFTVAVIGLLFLGLRLRPRVAV